MAHIGSAGRRNASIPTTTTREKKVKIWENKVAFYQEFIRREVRARCEPRRVKFSQGHGAESAAAMKCDQISKAFTVAAICIFASDVQSGKGGRLRGNGMRSGCLFAADAFRRILICLGNDWPT